MAFFQKNFDKHKNMVFMTKLAKSVEKIDDIYKR